MTALNLSGISVRSALRRPPKRAPQLLVLPERQRVENALRYACAAPVDIVTIELERSESQAYGEVLELVSVVMFPEPDQAKRLTLRHVMPGGEPDMRHILGGAEAHGQTIRMHFRKYGGAWARPVLFADD